MARTPEKKNAAIDRSCPGRVIDTQTDVEASSVDARPVSRGTVDVPERLRCVHDPRIVRIDQLQCLDAGNFVDFQGQVGSADSRI